MADQQAARTPTDGAVRNKREQAAADARDKILAAAAECIVRDGLAQVRMAAIARAAGVSSGLLHYHFDTKEQLFGEVLRYSHAVSAELSLHALANAGDDPAVRLASFLERCLPSDHQRSDEWLLWQELTLLCLRDPQLAEVSIDLYEDLYAGVADIIRAGMVAGIFRTALDPRFLAETAIALTDGLGERVLARDPRFGADEAREAVATAIGVLVGHDGPLPAPATFLRPARGGTQA